jgi:spermidine synthase
MIGKKMEESGRDVRPSVNIMNEKHSSQPGGFTPPGRHLPIVLTLFVGSGCAALIYEVIWFQLLELVIGSAAVSIAVLLATFMGGMCIGSLGFSLVVSSRRHPLRVYALFELGIGVCGLLILFILPYLDQFYVAYVGHGLSAVLLRGLVCAICLLPPTLLMGATLPAISRWVETTPRGVSWLGFFYAGNTVGAVCGCLLAGFYLLRIHDLTVATYVAAAINGSVALAGLLLAAVDGRKEGQSEKSEEVSHSHVSSFLPSSRRAVYLTIALSGMTALGAEVVWTRLLSLLLGATVYTFSIILAVFLAGLGIGSSVGAAVSRTVRPQAALGVCQATLAAAIAWAAYVITQSLPHWPIDPSLMVNPWVGFQLDILRCAWAVLPAALLWGASFPLALAAAVCSVPREALDETVTTRDPGWLVGRVYAANTVGAILGAILLSMIVIPRVGTQQAQRLLIGLSVISALVVLVPLLWSASSQGIRFLESRTPRFRPVWAVMLVLMVAIATSLAWSVPKVPWELVAYGRYVTTRNSGAKSLYMGEGMNASVAVTEENNGVRNFHVSGKVEASSEPQDMRLQRMLGHLSALLGPEPRSVLVVGCGAGVTAGTFVLYPDVERIVICEIEPLIPKVVAEYFKDENYGVVNDPRVEIVYDDARHYVLTTKEKFDVITSDPIHPWVKGAATLYTKEYFQTCAQHLKPGGVITQWVPLYESTLDVVKSELATFFDVFPNGTIWSNDVNGQGYDLVVLAREGPMQIDVDDLEKRLNRDDYLSAAQSLEEVGFYSATELLATYAGHGADLQPWLEDGQINHDRNLRLQYLAGLGLNSYQEGRIYDQILTYRRFPEQLFIGADGTRETLRGAIFGAKRS